jgi:hypothetical protein
MLRIARGDVDAHGPDVGLIVLPRDHIGFLRSEKVFYNLDKRATEFDKKYLPKDLGFWFTCGILGETERDMPPDSHFAAITGYEGLCGVGANPDEELDGEHDYLEVRVPYAPDTEAQLPKSFGGLSGGGLWQVTLQKPPNGQLEPGDPILSGVIFYQTAIDQGLRRLRCHGRRTVHEVVPTYARNLHRAP